MQMENTFHTIEIDCEPMSKRPDSYIEGVIADTGLVIEDFQIVSKLFGNWTWKLINEEKAKTFVKAKPILKERITKLHDNGNIRYGSW